MTAAQRQRATRRLTPKAREKFLFELSAGWSVAHAARVANVARDLVYRIRDEDEAFAAEWQRAFDAGVEALEQQALVIAMRGVVEETRDGAGKLVSTRMRPDPQMVRFLLASKRPEVYSERARVEVTGHNGGPVEVTHRDGLTLADVARFAATLGADVIDGEAEEIPAGELDTGTNERGQ